MTTETADRIEPYGARMPGAFDRAVIALTASLPINWLGMRFAIGLRRLVTMRMDDDSGIDVERWGLKLRLHPRRNGCEKGLLFTPQFYEAAERAALAARIAAARAAGRTFTFIDVGANVGLFSFFVASSSHDCRILAVEPEAEHLRRLRFNAAANGGLPIAVVPHALGESAGQVAIDVHPRDRGGTRTVALDDPAAVGAVAVECRPLREVLAEAGIQAIDALKIDVEGMEDRVLLPFFRDAPESLWPRFVIVEDTRALWRDDLFAAMEACGYRVAARTKLNVMLER